MSLGKRLPGDHDCHHRHHHHNLRFLFKLCCFIHDHVHHLYINKKKHWQKHSILFQVFWGFLSWPGWQNSLSSSLLHFRSNLDQNHWSFPKLSSHRNRCGYSNFCPLDFFLGFLVIEIVADLNFFPHNICCYRNHRWSSEPTLQGRLLTGWLPSHRQSGQNLLFNHFKRV